ncbi:NUDIX domain-containing protein [Paenibacillus albiflavus]|uniref:NUDIX domain-containing protein n=1 Tax=Paenibacillus albiflavus TaxID=2545760 RepID=A0A4R4EI08_9BACL|nr:NUDIX domain-containing protein [Paenibacillus albiflavus]TCZ79327.1 NUDIX domain-containing protein [Paenibacillus albiflavus]
MKVGSRMPIIINKKGDVFEEFLEISEEDIFRIKLDYPLTHSLVVAKYKDKYLLLFNRWRKEWEVPGGIIENGETCRDCAIRELYEETNQKASTLTFNGLMKFNLHNGKTEYGALYSSRLEQINEFIRNDEAEQIVFWDETQELDNINEIDKKLLEYYKES